MIERGAAVAPWRILGIDPGTLRLGYGVVELSRGAQGTDVRYIECGVISAPARLPRAERLAVHDGAGEGIRRPKGGREPGAPAPGDEWNFRGEYIKHMIGQ